MKNVTMTEMKSIIHEKYFKLLYKGMDIKNAKLFIHMEILLFYLWKSNYKYMDEIYDRYTESVKKFKVEK